MTIVLIACAVRMFSYANLPAPIWVLPVELISGFTFSMCYVLIASYSSLITIPGTESTVQGLFGAMFDGLGAYANNPKVRFTRETPKVAQLRDIRQAGITSLAAY